jgi:hypothetical protein
MSFRFNLKSVRWAVIAAAACVAAGSGFVERRAAAAEPLKESTSLQFIPADAAFYSTSLRMKEQYDAFVKSNAFKRLKSMAVVQMAMAKIKEQLDKPRVAGFLSQPENKELLALLGEMFSHEVFVVGDQQFSDLTSLFVQVGNAGRIAQLEALLEGNLQGGAGGPYHYLKALDANRAKLKAPSLIVGFKIADAGRAKKQLARLQVVIEGVLARQPELKKRFRKTTIGGNEYLSLQLDGSLVPWDKAPIAAFERKPGEFDKLLAHLKSLKLAVTIGLRGKHVLLAIGETNDHLKRLGGGPLLYDRAEFAPLRKNAGKPITSVSYVSERFARSGGDPTGQLEQMIAVARKAFEKSPVDEKIKREFRADVAKLRQALRQSSTQAGATMAFKFRNSRGFEGFSYNYGKNDSLDFSKKLTLLEHVGGFPIFFAVGRSKYDPESYSKFATVVKKLFYYGEAAALPRLNDEQRAVYQKARRALLPLVARLHKVNEELIIPALKDGQAAFVLDAKITSKQWIKQMPAADSPLPMLELGAVFGVSDAEKLRKGCTEYLSVAQELLDLAHQAAPGVIPEIKIPPATATKTAAGTVYHFPQLQQLGVDAQIAPSAALSKSVAVLSTSPRLAKQALRPTPLSLEPGLLTDRNRPLGSATSFNWPALVDTITPWVKYGVTRFFENRFVDAAFDAKTNQKPQIKSILDQVRTGAEVLKCFRGLTTATYREGNAIVTHSESVWRDLKD